MKKKSWLKLLYNVFVVIATVGILGGALNFYFGVGYLLVVLTHEAGHYFASVSLNVKVKFGGFTPFGAYVKHDETLTVKESSIIAICGPMLGLVFGLFCYGIYLISGDKTFILLSFISVALNLTNLIPVKPLDGGHIAEAISPYLSLIGFPCLIYLIIISDNLKSRIISVLLLLIGTYQSIKLFSEYNENGYYQVVRGFKIKLLLSYLVLLLFLIGAFIYFTNKFDFKVLINEITRYRIKP